MKSQTKDQPLKCSDLLSVNTYHVPPAFKVKLIFAFQNNIFSIAIFGWHLFF